MDNNKTTFTLPEGWIWTTIGEIGIVTSGGTPSTRNPEFWGGDIAWITPADLSNYKDVYIDKGTRSITKVGLEYSSAKLLPKGSILFSSRAPIGYVVIAKNEMATNQGFKNIILTKSLLSEYVYYYLKTIKPLAEKMASGTTFLELSAAKFIQIPFPLPPLPEQYRIVSKIEELFSELDHAEEGLIKAQKQLEVYRQALLKSAFEGKLTEKWREENHFKIIEIDDFINKQLPKGWIWNNFGNIAKITMGQSPLGDTYNNIGEGIPLINGPVEFNKSPFSKTKKEKWTTQPIRTCKEGDLLICVRGSTTGRQNIAGFDASIGRGVAAIHVPEKITINYLAYFTHFSERQIYEMGTGSTFPSISKEQISNFLIPICIVKEQDQIVQELEMRFTLIENFENSIEDGLLKIRLFRHSILRKAYEGKLVPQSKNDEPATTLLKLISLEKEAYILNQKMIVKDKPIKKKPMDTNNTIKEILEKTVQPIESRELWLKSKHKDNIEEFYAELKKIEHEIDILIEGKESSIILKR